MIPSHDSHIGVRFFGFEGDLVLLSMNAPMAFSDVVSCRLFPLVIRQVAVNRGAV